MPSQKHLSLSILFIIIQSVAGRWGSSFYMENLDDAYFDMSKGMGNGVTKVDWEVDRQTTISTRKKTSKIDLPSGKCQLQFLSKRDPIRNANKAVFSSGEVGYWKLKQSPPAEKSLLESSYEEAVESCTRRIEIEVPSRKDRSMIVYDLPVGTGNVQPLAVVSQGKGSVKYYESASRLQDEMGKDLGIKVGSVLMRAKSGQSIVDPNWGRKCKTWFWGPREQRGMKSVF